MQLKRLQREIAQLLRSPPEGCVCFPVGESVCELEARLQPLCPPYDQGVFKIVIVCGDKYPNEPPSVRFVTPIYHPNIDSEGRVCLNLLKMPPKGCWSPSYNVASVLAGLQILLAQPNPDDPLMTDITDEYRTDYHTFARKAAEFTRRHATATQFVAGSSGGVDAAQPAAPLPRDVLPEVAPTTVVATNASAVGTVDDCPFIREDVPVKRLKLL